MSGITYPPLYSNLYCDGISFKTFKPWVAVSGYVDPPTIGHLAMVDAAAKKGRVVFIVNNRIQTLKKKKMEFMPEAERLYFISRIKDVEKVVLSIDEDETINKTLSLIRPDYFLNSGDVNETNCREVDLCKKLGIQLIFDPNIKIQSSSDLLDKAVQAYLKDKITLT